ncbi:hypothetical protein ACIBSV_37325 [Embleya sp. NPDC050154]|uniref:hypothetical protein n=1 Tax=Embleya sp. NPDC050154 TaxID=3363988 RepID=UPI0037885A73
MRVSSSGVARSAVAAGCDVVEEFVGADGEADASGGGGGFAGEGPADRGAEAVGLGFLGQVNVGVGEDAVDLGGGGVVRAAPVGEGQREQVPVVGAVPIDEDDLVVRGDEGFERCDVAVAPSGGVQAAQFGERGVGDVEQSSCVVCREVAFASGGEHLPQGVSGEPSDRVPHAVPAVSVRAVDGYSPPAWRSPTASASCRSRPAGSLGGDGGLDLPLAGAPRVVVVLGQWARSVPDTEMVEGVGRQRVDVGNGDPRPRGDAHPGDPRDRRRTVNRRPGSRRA